MRLLKFIKEVIAEEEKKERAEITVDFFDVPLATDSMTIKEKTERINQVFESINDVIEWRRNV